MSLPWTTRGLKIPYVDRNDRKSRSLAIAIALSCRKTYHAAPSSVSRFGKEPARRNSPPPGTQAPGTHTENGTGTHLHQHAGEWRGVYLEIGR
jgi:hypothetical protein